MSRRYFIVSLPLVVVRNLIVSAPGEDEAARAAIEAPAEWYDRAMHNERIVGVYKTLDGVPLSVKSLDEPDPDMGVLS